VLNPALRIQFFGVISSPSVRRDSDELASPVASSADATDEYYYSGIMSFGFVLCLRKYTNDLGLFSF